MSFALVVFPMELGARNFSDQLALEQKEGDDDDHVDEDMRAMKPESPIMPDHEGVL